MGSSVNYSEALQLSRGYSGGKWSYYYFGSWHTDCIIQAILTSSSSQSKILYNTYKRNSFPIFNVFMETLKMDTKA